MENHTFSECALSPAEIAVAKKQARRYHLIEAAPAESSSNESKSSSTPTDKQSAN